MTNKTSAQAPKQTFFNAFSTPFGSCRGSCNCGKTYYNEDSGWDLNENELKELKKENAISLDCSIGFVEFEGLTYVYNCDCWHARATMIQNFIDGHAAQIASYLNAEAKRLRMEADSFPTVGV